MKKLCFIIMTLVTTSCVMYSDKDEYCDPAFSIASSTYNNRVSSLFRSAELYMFFSEYQTIREDRKASEELMKSYFGDYYGYLYYEEAYVSSWGGIHLTDTEGVYRVTNRYMYESRYDESLISSDGEKIVITGYKDDERVLEAELRRDGKKMMVTSLDLSFSDSDGTEVSISLVEPMMMDICSEGSHSYYPDSGSLKYRISGSVEDEFTVTYKEGQLLVGKNGIETIYNAM